MLDAKYSIFIQKMRRLASISSLMSTPSNVHEHKWSAKKFWHCVANLLSCVCLCLSKVSQKSLESLSKVSQKSLKSLSEVSQKSLKNLSKVSQKSLKSLSKASQKSRKSLSTEIKSLTDSLIDKVTYWAVLDS